MSTGVYFALKPREATRLLAAAGDDEAVEAVLEAIEERWDQAWLVEVDKAWDALHRCLAEGRLSFESRFPLHQCVLGGRRLYQGEEAVASFLTVEEVKDVTAAIQSIDEAWMRQKYNAIPQDDYPDPLSDEDFEYTWTAFQAVKAFYQKAIRYNRAVVFTAQ